MAKIATEALHPEKNILIVAGPAGAGGAISKELDVLDKMNKQEEKERKRRGWVNEYSKRAKT